MGGISILCRVLMPCCGGRISYFAGFLCPVVGARAGGISILCRFLYALLWGHVGVSILCRVLMRLIMPCCGGDISILCRVLSPVVGGAFILCRVMPTTGIKGVPSGSSNPRSVPAKNNRTDLTYYYHTGNPLVLDAP